MSRARAPVMSHGKLSFLGFLFYKFQSLCSIEWHRILSKDLQVANSGFSSAGTLFFNKNNRLLYRPTSTLILVTAPPIFHGGDG